MIVKEEMEDLAMEIFKDTGIMIKTEGKKHLGAVIVSPEFKSTYTKLENGFLNSKSSQQVKPIGFEATMGGGGAYNHQKHLPIIDYAVCIISKHILASFQNF